MTRTVRVIGLVMACLVAGAILAGIWKASADLHSGRAALVGGLFLTEVILAGILILLGSIVEGFGYGLSLGTRWPYTRNILVLMIRGDPEAAHRLVATLVGLIALALVVLVPSSATINGLALVIIAALFGIGISGPDHPFADMETFVFANESSLPTPEYGELHRRICEDFFKHEDAAALPELLAARGSPIRRDELTTYLRLLHLHALNTVLTRMEEAALLPARPMDDPLRAANTKPIAVRAIIGALKGHEREHPDKPDIAEVISSSFEVVAIQQDLISEYNGVSLKRGVAWKVLISEFPRRHVRALEQLLYNDWYTACFVADPTDASLWGTYGNGHQGVCLKFKATASTNGKPTLKLRQVCGSNGAPIYGDVAHEFQQVEYGSQFVEVNFFRSLGRLTMPMLRHWYRDAVGTPSTLTA
jgi:hypothetical protein